MPITIPAANPLSAYRPVVFQAARPSDPTTYVKAVFTVIINSTAIVAQIPKTPLAYNTFECDVQEICKQYLAPKFAAVPPIFLNGTPYALLEQSNDRAAECTDTRLTVGVVVNYYFITGSGVLSGPVNPEISTAVTVYPFITRPDQSSDLSYLYPTSLINLNTLDTLCDTGYSFADAIPIGRNDGYIHSFLFEQSALGTYEEIEVATYTANGTVRELGRYQIPALSPAPTQRSVIAVGVGELFMPITSLNWLTPAVPFQDPNVSYFSVQVAETSGINLLRRKVYFRFACAPARAVRAYWFNRFAGLDALTFTVRASPSLSHRSETLQRSLTSPTGITAVGSVGRLRYDIQQDLRIELQSQDLPASQLAAFSDIHTSPVVYVLQGNEYIPYIPVPSEQDLVGIQERKNLRITLERANQTITFVP